MIDVIKKDILADLKQAIDILEVKEEADVLQLQKLSEHAIEDVAVYKDTDAVATGVMFYSLFKIIPKMNDEEYRDLVDELQKAYANLQKNNFSRYNASMKTIFNIIQKCHAQVREHLQDVMQAARIKNAHALVQRGLSIGQAAGLMGLSNWDLQQYAGRTTALEQHDEAIPAKERLRWALRMFHL
ncbi:hypothetical protein HYX14_04065 [Candidatus Woesearchaeota archaeon]|nr:hypothetical protein [Candidatus Woesearchaeota archaeon]